MDPAVRRVTFLNDQAPHPAHLFLVPEHTQVALQMVLQHLRQAMSRPTYGLCLCPRVASTTGFRSRSNPRDFDSSVWSVNKTETTFRITQKFLPQFFHKLSSFSRESIFQVFSRLVQVARLF